MNPKKTKSFFISATNIHQGGGRTLLLTVLKSLPSELSIYLFVDTRMVIPEFLGNNVIVKVIKPTVFHRLSAEWQLFRLVASSDVVLCFGSLPPIFSLKGRVQVFVQNKYVIDSTSLNCFPLKIKFRLFVERIWFKLRCGKVHSFIVQTPSMKAHLADRLFDKLIQVHEVPFVQSNQPYLRRRIASDSKKHIIFDFIYIASGDPHKNHRRLIEAWIQLSKEEIFPSLALTLDNDESENLRTWLNEMKSLHKLRITNLGSLTHDKALELYSSALALIYPSTLESFGLPLIEARQANLSVVASELDFVRDVLDPEESFDPYSPRSISSAVKRFLGREAPPLHLVDAKEFLRQITKGLQ